MPSLSFQELASKIAAQKATNEGALFRGSLISFDPGKTTGYAVFNDLQLITFGQLDTSELGPSFKTFYDLFQQYHPTLCVVEDYRVYKHKQKQHAWSELHTAKLIGVLEGAAYTFEDIERVIKQPAHVAKGFCTDQRLKEWDMYARGQRHARDAIRHGCYQILFGGTDKWHEKLQRGNVTKTTVG